jgi:CRP-like cAMP-binding protein
VEAGDLERLRDLGTETTIDAGRVLIERGQHGSGLFVILDGTVLVEAPEATRELGPGSVVGERALFASDGRRTARVRTLTDVRVVAVERAEFERLCATDPALADRVAALAEL